MFTGIYSQVSRWNILKRTVATVSNPNNIQIRVHHYANLTGRQWMQVCVTVAVTVTVGLAVVVVVSKVVVVVGRVVVVVVHDTLVVVVVHETVVVVDVVVLVTVRVVKVPVVTVIVGSIVIVLIVMVSGRVVVVVVFVLVVKVFILVVVVQGRSVTVVLCVVVVVVVVGRGTLVVVVSVNICVVVVVAVGRTVVVRVVDTVVLTVHTHLRFFRHFSPNSKVSSWAFELTAPMIGSTIVNRTIASFSRNPLLCIFDAATLQSEFLLSCLPIIASIANKYGSFRATRSDLGYADRTFLARHSDLILWPIFTNLYPVPIRNSIKRTGTSPRITILDEKKRCMCNR